MIKAIVVIAFLAIVFSLGSALYHLMQTREGETNEKTVKALTIRIGLSIVLFGFIFMMYATGMIQPEGIGARIQQQRLQSHP
ncbi:MAG: hypothetical protein RL637_1332 [Pseudomonadota bacterium]|jgi:heme/copper-type cytochrome/quinol oxidase subunit 4